MDESSVITTGVEEKVEELTSDQTAIADETLYKEQQQNRIEEAVASASDASEGQIVPVGSVNGNDNEARSTTVYGNEASGSQDLNNSDADAQIVLTNTPEPVAMFNIWQSRTSCCVNNTVDFKCTDELNIERLVWKLNGEVVVKDKRNLTLFFDRKGQYIVELVVTDVLGKTSGKTAKVNVNGAQADFAIDQMSGELQVSSKHPWSSNQWYINNVLIDGDRSTLVVGDYSGEVQITHVVTGVNGCSDTLRKTTEIMTSCDIKIVDIPNVFTPYLVDGKNDEFDVTLSEEASQYRLTVISPQSGEVVFETDNPNEAWNGKRWNQGQLLPYGWYTYQLAYGCGGAMQQKRGKVLLAR